MREPKTCQYTRAAREARESAQRERASRPHASKMRRNRAQETKQRRSGALSERAQETGSKISTVIDQVLGWASLHKVLATLIVVLGLSFAFLYGPSRDLYVAWRHGQYIAAQQETLNQQNEQLTDENNKLMTREGIEAKAREMGYVDGDETGVQVVGADDAGDKNQSTQASTENEPWYIQLGDMVFGYHE